MLQKIPIIATAGFVDIDIAFQRNIAIHIKTALTM